MTAISAAGTGERPVVAACLGQPWRHTVLDHRARAVVARNADLIDLDTQTLRPLSGDAPLTDVSVLITGWGTPRLDEAALDALPALRLVAHAAGSVRELVTDAVWERGIRVSTAADANAVSVADFTLAQVQLALKNAWRLAAQSRTSAAAAQRAAVRGVDGAVIGLVGIGRIGRLVAERLAALDVQVLAFDPHTDARTCAALGAEKTELDELFSRSDVVSLHAPLMASTVGMITPDLLLRMPEHATFINTARGALVDNDELAAVLERRPDLFALLDVTEPEPLRDRHPLLTLPNTFITPHVAGSLGTEEARLGALAAAEVDRFLTGAPLLHTVEEERLALSA
ncbi:hydroxyacid dehydrogenase [Microbacterium sp. NPDC058342]|uniref:hydroxyacid dehydrogenase n=1 Tax=Microbacterium sp. NPDC058342 TaxID=3346454 RepID=UPI0036559616